MQTTDQNKNTKEEMLKYVDQVMEDLEKERSVESGTDTMSESGTLLGLCIRIKSQLKYKVGKICFI